jgi:hypothetical protein
MLELKGYGENNHEKPGHKCTSCWNQFTFPEIAGTSPYPVGNNTNTRSSNLHQASRTPGFPYSLISSISFSSSSPIYFALVHHSTIIVENQVTSSCSISPCHDYLLTPSTSLHRAQLVLATLLDCHFGSGSGSEQNRLPRGCPGRQQT